MHVTVIGAGALGRTYGVYLADAGLEVSFVIRASSDRLARPFVVEPRTGDKRARRIERPERVTAVPASTSVMLLAVRREHLSAGLERTLAAAPDVPLVVLTPVLPGSERRLRSHVTGPMLIALPTVAARLDGETVSCFVPPLTKTLVDRDGGEPAVVSVLIDALNRAGLPCAWASGVRRRNPATTIAFFPLTVGLSVAGDMSALLRDAELCALTLAGVRETVALGQRVGPVALPLRLALGRLSPGALRVLVQVARRAEPDLSALLEEHFANKLTKQHHILGAEILELGRNEAVPLPALTELLARLRAVDTADH